MEQPHQVLSLAGVDPGLAADRTVHLREKGRRDLDVVEPAEQDPGGEPGDVADHAAAERHQAGRALHGPVEERVGEVPQMVEALGLLSRRQDHVVAPDPLPGEAVLEFREIKGRDVGVGDHDDAGPRQHGPEVAAGVRQEALADPDVV